MVRDWKLGTIAGLSPMRLPLETQHPEMPQTAKTQYETLSSRTVTETETQQVQFGLIEKESDGDRDCQIIDDPIVEGYRALLNPNANPQSFRKIRGK